jgi:pyruvate/2-oxoglutarate dehydrogenase complex dihydrolipoamide dehydrogenase (E3) component
MSQRFDAIVIGTGQAGPTLARRLAAAGMSVAIIEWKLFGVPQSTPAVYRPKRWWLAHAAHTARRGAEYGFAFEEAAGGHGAGQARAAAISAQSAAISAWPRG